MQSMTPEQATDPSAILEVLGEILRLYPEGLSEYALLQRLREDQRTGVDSGRLDDPLRLFRTHFLLFHYLYLLQDRVAAAGTGRLDIHVLRIRWLPAPAVGTQAVALPDPLRTYYLDIANLDTSAADVEGMLAEFWLRFRRYDRRREALAVLELPTDADAEEILLQYRRLAMRHHPDRGGDAMRLQAVHRAMAILDPRKFPE